MTWTLLALPQVLLACHPTSVDPLRFGFPLPATALERGLRIAGGAGARLQWRRLQRRPDPRTGRLWVELCVTGAKGRFRISAGSRRGGPTDVSASAPGVVVHREVAIDDDGDRRVEVTRWHWHTGAVDEVRRISFARRMEYAGEEFEAGETLTLGLLAARFTGAGIKTRAWRRAGVLPGDAGIGREYRTRLVAAVRYLVELKTLRDRGDYRRSSDVMTNLEFDTTLAFARLGLAQSDTALLGRALRSAVHSVDHDLDVQTSLLFRHGKDHRRAPPDLGHTWLAGILLVGCLAADDRLIAAAGRIANGLAQHPAMGQGRSDRVRDVGWPLLEMETWLRFADDPAVAAAVAGAVRRLLKRWDPRNRVFRFGEGEGRRGIYDEPLWVTAGCLVPGLRAYVARTGDRRVAKILDRLERRMCDLIRAGKPGLPLRYRTIAGRVISVSRLDSVPPCFMLLEGLSPGELRRCLQRRQVRAALLEVPGFDDEDLATSLSIVGRCSWIYR